MDAVLVSRLQFATTTIYHFFFVPLTLGLSIFVAGTEGNAAGPGLLFGLGTLAAVYGVTRAWFRARLRGKERALTRLLDRLATIVHDYDAPALPGPPAAGTKKGPTP